MARTICNTVVDENRTVTVITLDPQIENIIANNTQKSLQGSFLSVDPETTTRILEKYVKQ